MDMVGYLFAGQGVQYVGMGKDLYEAFLESKAVFDKANAALGLDLKRICFDGPEDMLKRTVISQPAILTVSIAAFEAFRAKVNGKPDFMAGLSLGEYTALIAAGAFTFNDGLRLVRRRSELMDEAARRKPGKMAAVLDLPIEKIKNICLQSSAEIANLNCPGQTVITGGVEAVDRAKGLCLEAGAKRVIDLEVSGGFHSSLMQEAALKLAGELQKIKINTPQIPLVSNVTAKPVTKPEEIRANLIKQITASVLWEDSMKFILSKNVTTFFEFGPGRVLKGLMRRIDENARVINIEKKEDILSLGDR